MWFRYDLRVCDNDALFLSSQNYKCLPVYILDTDYLNLDTTSNFHLNFLNDSLKVLNVNLDNNLNFYEGKTIEVLKFLLKKHNIKKIFSNKIFKNNFHLDIDKKVQTLLKEFDIEWVQTNQFGIQLKNRKRNTWSKDWKNFINKPIRHKHKKETFIKDKIFSTLKFYNNFSQSGGETNSTNLLNSFLEKRHYEYRKRMSSPLLGESSCSRLSPHLAFGTISLKKIVKKLNLKINSSDQKDLSSLISFKKRLAWHCHFIQKFYDQPNIENKNMHPSYDGLRENDFNETFFNKWKDGYTGFPFLDACMRFLKKRGWLNFRMRAMIVSFASYQLWLDWKITSNYLAKVFTDFEPGIHYSQIQMQSGTTGINTIRIYNVIKQSFEQDPEGKFIKKWIPELRKLPVFLIHEPWKINFLEQKEYNFQLGKDYPKPIIDNLKQTRIAKEKIWKIKSSTSSRILAKEIVKKHASFNRNFN